MTFFFEFCDFVPDKIITVFNIFWFLEKYSIAELAQSDSALAFGAWGSRFNS